MPLSEAATKKLQEALKKYEGCEEPPNLAEDDWNEKDEAEDVGRQVEDFAEAMDRASGVTVRRVTDELFNEATAPDVPEELAQIQLTIVQGGPEEAEPEPEYLPEKLLVYVQFGKWIGKHRVEEFSNDRPVLVLAKAGLGFGPAIEEAIRNVKEKVMESEAEAKKAAEDKAAWEKAAEENAE